MHACNAALLGATGVDWKYSDNSRWRTSESRTESRCAGSLLRVSIPGVVLAVRGSQQALLEDDRHVVLLDGWINCRDELLSHAGLSSQGEAGSDTLAIARLFASLGPAAIALFTGSFALAVVDKASGTVTLVRDRFGTRPLYFAAAGKSWIWASELKCLTPLLDRVTLDPEGLRQSVNYRYVLAHTLLKGVRQVPPACLVQLDAGKPAREKQYWTLEFTGTEPDPVLDAWADQVDAALDADIARLRRRSQDVAILLSGGVDSSLIATKVAQAGFRRCIALTARWQGDNPELQHAVAVARHLGIEHRIIDLDDQFIRSALPWLVWRLEEPPRHFNSFVLAKLMHAVRNEFDTLLSGHAADALFGPQHAITIRQFSVKRKRLEWIPRPVARAMAESLPVHHGVRWRRWHEYLLLGSDEFELNSFRIEYGQLAHPVFGSLVRDPAPSPAMQRMFYLPTDSMTERFQRFDIYGFNQSHLSVFDRIGSQFGQSVILPFLAPEVVSVACRLPSSLKSDGDMAKPVLKALAARYLPREWVYRRKQGFPTDTVRWLSGPLRGWRAMLEEPRSFNRAVFDIRPLLNADPNQAFEAIWTATTFELFCRQLIDGDAGPERLAA